MKKIINQPEEILTQMLEGLTYAYSDLVERVPETDVIVRKNTVEGKVGLVSGGGSGHEPSHAGFVGKGMLSAAVCGEVFTSPTPDQVLEGIKAADTGAGVLLIIKNYSGDVMNFEMAKDMAEMEDIQVETIIVDDDVAVEDSTYTAGRRGVAGTVLVHKILGAYADQGRSLAEVKEVADNNSCRKVNQILFSLSLLTNWGLKNSLPLFLSLSYNPFKIASFKTLSTAFTSHLN